MLVEPLAELHPHHPPLPLPPAHHLPPPTPLYPPSSPPSVGCPTPLSPPPPTTPFSPPLLAAGDRQGRIALLHPLINKSAILFLDSDHNSKSDIQNLYWIQTQLNNNSFRTLTTLSGPSLLSFSLLHPTQPLQLEKVLCPRTQRILSVIMHEDESEKDVV
ncbi:uncharacterized protein LOC131299725 [Rhododendron vialii]|uniref:uncharacterized protein LOC131299725 n=1 Tax=Rhododendron vialii TaxID=182163 RepID=UPI0026604F33|nr:uncharacterized protein LOC131299725 [Rhododendron vialii]